LLLKILFDLVLGGSLGITPTPPSAVKSCAEILRFAVPAQRDYQMALAVLVASKAALSGHLCGQFHQTVVERVGPNRGFPLKGLRVGIDRLTGMCHPIPKGDEIAEQLDFRFGISCLHFATLHKEREVVQAAFKKFLRHAEQQMVAGTVKGQHWPFNALPDAKWFFRWGRGARLHLSGICLDQDTMVIFATGNSNGAKNEQEYQRGM
jgi:hypothetical protein